MKKLNIEFYTNPKLTKNQVHIGKTGQLRFKKDIVEQFKIEKGQRWKIGWDASEKKATVIYMILDNDCVDGFKISYSNSTHHMNLKGVITKLGIKTPNNCKYESFKQDDYQGIKIILSNL